MTVSEVMDKPAKTVVVLSLLSTVDDNALDPADKVKLVATRKALRDGKLPKKGRNGR